MARAALFLLDGLLAGCPTFNRTRLHACLEALNGDRAKSNQRSKLEMLHTQGSIGGLRRARRTCRQDSGQPATVPIRAVVARTERGVNGRAGKALKTNWLPGMDSNHDSRLQRPLSYR